MSAGLEPQLGAVAAAYVLFSALLGTLLMHAIEPLVNRASEAESLKAQTETHPLSH